MFFDRKNTSSLSFSGDSSLTIVGALYGRSATVELDGTPAVKVQGGPLVIGELKRVGNATVSVSLKTGP